MKVLVIDNYDSFTYNLVHDLERNADVQVDVIRNDLLSKVSWSTYDRIVISPGPGLPRESGELMWALSQLETSNIPVLGICLGLQAMVEHTGGTLYNLNEVSHGQPKTIHVQSTCPLFSNIRKQTVVGMYHSWAAQENSLSKEWMVTAKSEEDVVMGIQHQKLPWMAVQFHPESVLSEEGRNILNNWIRYYN